MDDSNNNILDDLFGENGLVDTNPNDGSQDLSIAPSGNATNNANFDTVWGAWWQKSEEANTYRDDKKDQGTKPSENQQPEPSGCTASEIPNTAATSSAYQAAAAIGDTPAQPTTGEQFLWDFSSPEFRASLNDLNQDKDNFDSFVRQTLANATEEAPTDPIATSNGPYSQFPANVTPAAVGVDPFLVNPAWISNVDATGMPLMDFNSAAIMPGPAGNLGIEPLTSGHPNHAPNLATEPPAPDRIDGAPVQNPKPQSIQTRRKKPSRSQQKAHFESMGVAVGYEFKRDGEIRIMNDQMYWLDPHDTWKPAVYHVDLREKFLRMTDSQGVYTHPPAQGASDLDRTSFFAPQRDWGFHAREYRPDVLFQWEEIETPEVPHPGFMIDQGRIVLDSHNHPVVNWDIPLTLSSEIEGGRLEAMHRLNSKINKDDFCARMPNERVDTSGKVGKRQIPNAFGQRMLRFRMKSGIPTWNTKTGSDEVRARIVECIPRETVAEILRTNSTRCFRDLSEKELLYVEQGNAGKAISRAGGHRLSKAERDKRFQRRFAGLKGWEPPNKRPWPENYTTYINGSRKGKRSEHENPRQRGDDSEPSESQSLTPSERQGFEFSRDTGYGQRNPQLTEEKENIPPARTEAPRSYANGMPKDQRRPNNQPTPQSQAQRALNDHIPVPNSEFWQYASIDENQRKRLHPTTEGYHYAKNISKESIPETPNIAANNSRQRFDYEVSPYNQKHGFKIYVSPESMRTHNDMEMPDMSYGQPDVAVPPSEFSRKRRMDQAFSQDEIALAPNRSSRKRKANATFSQDEIALPFNEFSRKRKVDEAFPLDETSRPNDLMPPPKRPAMQMQHKPTDSNPPNEGDGRYDDPENFDEVRFIQSALSNTLAELSQRLGYTPDIETCPNHSYIRQFNQIESWFKANWRGTKAAPKLTTMEKPWKGGIPPPEELFLGF